MSLPNSVLTIALCFGLGLGLAPALRAAQACSCESEDWWRLELRQITGDGEPAAEQAFWPTDVFLEAGFLHLGNGEELYLRAIP